MSSHPMNRPAPISAFSAQRRTSALNGLAFTLRRALHRTKPSSPLAVLREQQRVGLEIARVKIAPVVQKHVANFFDVFEPLNSRGQRLVRLCRKRAASQDADRADSNNIQLSQE